MLPQIHVIAQDQEVNNAYFALLGIAISGGVTLIALITKFIMDSRLEAKKYERQRDLEDKKHERDLEKLKLEVTANRSATLEVQEAEVVARFLAAAHDIFSQMQSARRQWDEDGVDDVYRTAVLAIRANEGQVALEEVRLRASDDVVDRASRLWSHLRGGRVPRVQSTAGTDWTTWRDKYWGVRKDLIHDYRTVLWNSPD